MGNQNPEIQQIQLELLAVRALMSGAPDEGQATPDEKATPNKGSDGEAKNSKESNVERSPEAKSAKSQDKNANNKTPPASESSGNSDSTLSKVGRAIVVAAVVAVVTIFVAITQGLRNAAKFVKEVMKHSDKTLTELKQEERKLEAELEKARNKSEKKQGGANDQEGFLSAMFEKVFLQAMQAANERGLKGQDASNYALSSAMHVAGATAADDYKGFPVDQSSLNQAFQNLSSKYQNASKETINNRISEIDKEISDAGKTGFGKDNKDFANTMGFFNNPSLMEGANNYADSLLKAQEEAKGISIHATGNFGDQKATDLKNVSNPLAGQSVC